MKCKPSLELEGRFWSSNTPYVFGIDEAGRGCLAGPVYAGVMAWPPDSSLEKLPQGIRDSKQISEPTREQLFDQIATSAWAYGVGFATAAEVDRYNVLKATYLAVMRAFELVLTKRLEEIQSHGKDTHVSGCAFLSDGGHALLTAGIAYFLHRPEMALEFKNLRIFLRNQKIVEQAVVKGDSKVYSIAAASILAKVSRDRRMLELAQDFPQYDFAEHKGYGTPRHLEKLRERGPCIEHRRSYAPVAEAFARSEKFSNL